MILGQARGRALDPIRLRRALRLRQLTRTVRQHGQIRLYNFGLYVDQGLWGHTVAVLVYDDMVRIEQAEQLVVSYPCVYGYAAAASHRDRRVRAPTIRPGTGEAVGFIDAGTGAYCVAHATLSPDTRVSTGPGSTANQLVTAVRRLNCPNPYRRFADTASIGLTSDIRSMRDSLAPSMASLWRGSLW